MTEDFKRYIEALALKCRHETYHGDYRLFFSWSEQPNPNDTVDAAISARIYVESVYLWAKITVYPEIFAAWQRADYKSIGRDILHEICHIFTEPLRALFTGDIAPNREQFVRETFERQTQRICDTIFDLLPKDWYTPEALGLEAPAKPSVIEIRPQQ